MASQLFTRTVGRRVFYGSAAVGVAVYTKSTIKPIRSDDKYGASAAEIQFNTPYGYVNDQGVQIVRVPEGWKGETFKIKNDYPKSSDLKSEAVFLPAPGGEIVDEAPWTSVDFRKEPERYAQMVKEYCFEGNVNNDFNIHKNSVREWYHAPWMHWNENGREPLNGLTFERPTPALELADTQTGCLQTWAIGFYNRAGASVFGDMWKDPNTPQWKPFKFPRGTAVFKILMTDATDEEVKTMKGAPSLQAVIAKQERRDVLVKSAAVRNSEISTLRLLQVDWAVQDDQSPIGWVFGTFMYDGSRTDSNPWDRLTLVGVMWGNDPQLNQAAVKEGRVPEQSYITPRARDILTELNGKRPTWGWNGRLNGPADNFVSACTSCHSTAEWTWTKDRKVSKMTPPTGADDWTIMRWFRNICAGKTFDDEDRGAVSGDYSLQLQMGYANFRAWNDPRVKGIWYNTRAKYGFGEPAQNKAYIEEKRSLIRDA